HQILFENTEILALLRKILPIPEDSSSTLAKAEININYDYIYFDEEFDDDVYFDEEVTLLSDKVELSQRSSSN
ncbi:2059_t:CDS:1, partial [Dentiscutata heterogama]